MNLCYNVIIRDLGSNDTLHHITKKKVTVLCFWRMCLKTVKVSVQSRYPCDYTCSPDFTSHGSGCTAACNYNPTLELCTTYPLRSLPDTSTHDQHWESNPKPSDLESNAPSTWPHTPTSMRLYLNIGAPEVNCNIFNIGAPSIFVYFSKAEFRL